MIAAGHMSVVKISDNASLPVSSRPQGLVSLPTLRTLGGPSPRASLPCLPSPSSRRAADLRQAAWNHALAV